MPSSLAKSAANLMEGWNLRCIVMLTVSILATILIGPYIILGSLLRFPLPWLEATCRLWAKLHLWSVRVPVNLSGVDNLPDPPAILVCNHQGLFDVLALLSYMPRPPVFVSKKELFRVPIFGHVLRVMGHIELDRSNRQKAIESINQGTQTLHINRQNLVFFPEGTRTRDGKLGPFKKGAFVFAIESGLPIVPIMIDGSYEILPPNTRMIHPGKVTVQILRPLSTEGYTLDGRDGLKEQVHTQIAEALQEFKGQKV